MKRITLLLFTISLSLFVSCSNDDNDDPTTIDQSLIPGVWKLTDITSEDGRFSTTLNGIPLTGNYEASGKDYTMEITFTETAAEEVNTFTSTGGFTAVGQVQIPTQDPIELEQNFPDFFGTGQWRIDGNKLITTVEGESQTYEIRELTSTTLKLAGSIDESVDYDLNGTNITVNLTGTIITTLSKS